jgi:hypothetical protein
LGVDRHPRRIRPAGAGRERGRRHELVVIQGLAELRTDVLDIDERFGSDLTHNDDGRRIVEAIV